MLPRQELEKYRMWLGFNIWQVERDYLQHIFLLFMSRRTGSELVFKGGTALQKTLGLNRFSIDLDFTQQGELPPALFTSIERDFLTMGITAHFSEEKKKEALTLKLSVQGPLYHGTERTLTILRIEISLREKIILPPETKEVIPVYPDLQPYLLKVMDPAEMLAEKVRAIFTRRKARDVFDFRFLLHKNVPLTENLINQKLMNYHLKYSRVKLLQELKKVEPLWEKELSQLLTTVPDYQEVLREIKERV